LHRASNFVKQAQKQNSAPPVQSDIPMPFRACDLRATCTDDQRRVAFAMYYLDVLEAPEPSEWHDTDGTIRRIMREFSIPRGRSVWLSGCCST